MRTVFNILCGIILAGFAVCICMAIGAGVASLFELLGLAELAR